MNTKLSFEYVKPAILSDLKAGIAPCLLGAPGIGKSTIIESLADETNTKLFKVACNQLATKEDLTGSRIIELKDVDSDNPADKYTQIMFPQTDIADAIKYAKDHPDENPILYLDEINRVSEDVTSACLSLVTDRRVGNVKLPDNLRIISAGNDEGNVAALDTASITRFSIYHVSADLDGWMTSQPGLNAFVKKTIEDNDTVDFIGDEGLYTKSEKQSMVGSNDDDDDESFEQEDVSMDFEAEPITQMAVPRTITYTSNWLNTLGFTDVDNIDSALLAKFTPLMTDPTTGDVDKQQMERTVFYQLLAAHSGETAFTKALFETFNDAFAVANHSTTNNARPVMTDKLPDQDADFAKDFFEAVQNFGDIASISTYEQTIMSVVQDPEASKSLLDMFVNMFFSNDKQIEQIAVDVLGLPYVKITDFFMAGLQDVTFGDLNVNKDNFIAQFAKWLPYNAANVSQTGMKILSSGKLSSNPKTLLTAIKNLNDIIKTV